jgi:hypothetical protein
MPGRWLAAGCLSAMAWRPVRLRAAPLWPARPPAPPTADQKLWQGRGSESPRQSVGVGCRRAVAAGLRQGQRAEDRKLEMSRFRIAAGESRR